MVGARGTLTGEYVVAERTRLIFLALPSVSIMLVDVKPTTAAGQSCLKHYTHKNITLTKTVHSDI